MQITQKAVEGLKHELTVTLSASDIDAKVDHRLNELAGQVRLPGFRPGKVPFSLLKKRFGDSVLGEVLERAVNDSSQKAIEERGLKPALQPKIELKNFVKGKDLEYTMAVEVLPEIEPMDFATVKLERLTAEVADEEVDKTLERLASEYRKTEPAPADHAAAKGDVLVIDYKGSIDGEDFPGGTGEGHYLELGSKSVHPRLRGAARRAQSRQEQDHQAHLSGRLSRRKAGRQGGQIRGHGQGGPAARAEQGR